MSIATRERPDGQAAIKIIDAVHMYVVRNIFFLRLLLVDADARDFRIGKGRPRHD